MFIKRDFNFRGNNISYKRVETKNIWTYDGQKRRSEQLRLLCNEELRDLYRSPVALRAVMARRLGWTGHMPKTEKTKECVKQFGGIPRRTENELGG
jgi:hypothetical protein